MGLRDLATVLIRLYGLSLLFYCLQTGASALMYIATPVPSEPMFRVGVLSTITISILYAVTGVCLLVFAKTISSAVAPKTSNGINVNVSAVDLGSVAFPLAGIVFFVDGLRWLLNDAIVWVLTPKSIGSTVDLDIRMTASLAMSALKVVFGVGLMFGARGLLRIFRWAQGGGRHEYGPKSRTEREPIIEQLKILKCPNCKAAYNPADYREDVLNWFCPQCGKALPKD